MKTTKHSNGMEPDEQAVKELSKAIIELFQLAETFGEYQVSETQAIASILFTLVGAITAQRSDYIKEFATLSHQICEREVGNEKRMEA